MYVIEVRIYHADEAESDPTYVLDSHVLYETEHDAYTALATELNDVFSDKSTDYVATLIVSDYRITELTKAVK